MTLDLIEPVKSILSDVEAATGKPLKFVEKDDMDSFAAVKIARRSMPAHIVFYRRQHDVIINHLVAHECGHILRMFGVPEEKRLIPAKSRDARSMLLEIEGDLNRISKTIPMKELIQVVGTWTNGLVMQLTSYPPDIMIEKWIYDGYPELRPFQLQSLERQNKQARYVSIVFTLLLVLGFIGSALAQTQAPPQTQTPTEPQYQKSACGPDHKIIYQRAVTLLDTADGWVQGELNKPSQ